MATTSSSWPAPLRPCRPAWVRTSHPPWRRAWPAWTRIPSQAPSRRPWPAPWLPPSTGAFAAGFAGRLRRQASPAQPRPSRAGAGGGGGGGAAGFTTGRGPPVRSENAPGRCGGAIAAAAAAAAASRAAFSIAAFSAAIFDAVGRAFSLAGFLECASSASRISLSASSCVIWPRRTMYCTRSRALSMANPASPAAALITSFIAEETLLPAS